MKIILKLYGELRKMKLYRKFHVICVPFRCCSKVVGLENDTEKVRKRLKLYCIPCPPSERISKISNVVGLHSSPSDIGWAEVNTKDREVVRLGCVSLPSNLDRMNLSELYHVASDTVESFPAADHYIMENVSKNVGGTAGRLQLTLHSTRLQLLAMLIALLNSRTSSENSADVTLFMRNRIHGRLYSLLVGSEVVTVEEVVFKLFRGQLSTAYTPMKCSPSVISYYNRRGKVQKEFMGHALLIATSFAELVVYGNVNCAEILGVS